MVWNLKHHQHQVHHKNYILFPSVIPFNSTSEGYFSIIRSIPFNPVEKINVDSIGSNIDSNKFAFILSTANIILLFVFSYNIFIELTKEERLKTADNLFQSGLE